MHRVPQGLLGGFSILLCFLVFLGGCGGRGGGAGVGLVRHQQLVARGRSVSESTLCLRLLLIAAAAVVELVQLQVLPFIDAIFNKYLSQVQRRRKKTGSNHSFSKVNAPIEHVHNNRYYKDIRLTFFL